jgi:hypothetical protein
VLADPWQHMQVQIKEESEVKHYQATNLCVNIANQLEHD